VTEGKEMSEDEIEENAEMINAFLHLLSEAVLASWKRVEGLSPGQVSYACLILAAQACASEITTPLPFMYATDRKKADQYLRQVSSDTVRTFKNLLEHKISLEAA
jgi:hypothetical protein